MLVFTLSVNKITFELLRTIIWIPLNMHVRFKQTPALKWPLKVGNVGCSNPSNLVSKRRIDDGEFDAVLKLRDFNKECFCAMPNSNEFHCQTRFLI